MFLISKIGKEVEEHAARFTINHHNMRHDTCPTKQLRFKTASYKLKNWYGSKISEL
jgi:hypothetical protein